MASVALSLAVSAAVLTSAPPAQALSATYTVTWTGSVLSPSSLPGAAVGSTIGLMKVPHTTVQVRNGTGAVHSPGGSCDLPTNCELDQAEVLLLGIDGLGTIDILESPDFAVVATLTLGSSGAPTGYPVKMTFDGNGADACSPAAASGMSTDSYSMPSANQCTRADYTLLGWAHKATATTPADANLTQPADPSKGPHANFVENGTLFAVWSPNGVEVTYDSNVASRDECWDTSGDNVAGGSPSARSDTIEQSPLDGPASTAVCKPPWAVLGGWSTKGSDAVPAFAAGTTTGQIVRLDQTLQDVWGASLPKKLNLYAVWTMPRVTLMSRPTDPNKADPRPVAWGSTITMGRVHQYGVGCVAESASAPHFTSGAGADAFSTTDGYYLVAKDLLGQPAAHTIVFAGSPGFPGIFGSALQFYGPGYQTSFGSTAPLYTIAAGGWAGVLTDKHGTTTVDLNSMPFGEPMPYPRPIQACPTASTFTDAFGALTGSGLSVIVSDATSPFKWTQAQVAFSQ